jgi:hypothetical protein
MTITGMDKKNYQIILCVPIMNTLHGFPFQISKKMNMLIEGLQYFVLHKILGAKSSVLIFFKSEETPEKK